MAFENAFLTEEEKAEFEAKAIPNPGNRFHTLKPSQWTIARDQDVALVWGSQEREEPSEYYFLLYWKGTPVKVKLKQNWISGSPRTWDLLRLSVPPHLVQQRDEIIRNLKEALTAWAFNGSPSVDFIQLNQNTKVQFTF